jgi:hypothetical protein
MLALLAFAFACSRSPEPCASAGTCPEGQECLANRCVVAGGEPVSPDSRRLVAEPTTIAVLSSRSHTRPSGLPGTVTFGGSAEGASALYLRFPPVWQRAKRIEAAFIVLDPMPGTLPSNDDVTVEAWRVRERWDASELTWLTQPSLVPPSSSGIARSSPPLPLRIDVTDIVSYLRAHGKSDFGIALKSGSGDHGGASFATGANGGRAPRLEVYAH